MNNHKSEYGVIQTIRFMIRQAVKEAPAVLVWLVVDAILALILQLLELYVTPVLLRDIEEQIALKELVTTILFFSSGILLLTGLKETFLPSFSVPEIPPPYPFSPDLFIVELQPPIIKKISTQIPKAICFFMSIPYLCTLINSKI